MKINFCSSKDTKETELLESTIDISHVWNLLMAENEYNFSTLIK